MKFSIWPQNNRPWGEVLDLAIYAEQTGWHGFWFADHLMPNRPDGTPDPGSSLECWSVLAAIGVAVPRLRLASMVSPVTIHHPVVLAKRATTVDHVSGGRAVLGLGAGWQVNEHASYGFELPPAGPRVTRFAEAIEVVHRLLHDDTSNFAGQHYRLTDAPFSPKPVQDPLPILVGSASPRMLRLAARWADQWNTWGEPELVAGVTAEFEKACAAVGRDIGTVHRSAQALVFLVDDSVDRTRLPTTAGRSLVGGPNELIDRIGGYVDLGVDELAIPDFTLGASAGERRHTLERLRTEVLDAFV